MAQTNSKDVIHRPDIVFYLYNKRDNKLQMRETKIYPIFNVKTQRFSTDKPDYYDRKYIQFWNDWTFKLSLDNYWPKDYDMFKEFLSFYNNKWWVLTKCHWEAEPHNWTKISAKTKPFYVTESKVKTDTIKEKEVIKEVQVQTIPRKIAEWMDFVQLRDLAKAWGVEIPEDIEASQNPETIQQEYLKILAEHLV